GKLWKLLKDKEAILTKEFNNIPKAQVKDLDVSSDEQNKDDENKDDAEVTKKQVGDEQPTTSTPTPPTTQAQVTNVPESDSSSKFEQRLLEPEKKVEAMPKRAWTKKDQKWIDEMVQMIDNRLPKRRFKSSLECFVGGRMVETDFRLLMRTV
ncbi:hypothetical protein Tco_1168576, partial [Tanacetum coccineum]